MLSTVVLLALFGQQQPTPLPNLPIGQLNARMTSDMSSVQSGVVKLNVHADINQSQWAERFVDMKVDGVPLGNRVYIGSANVSQSSFDVPFVLDTTRLSDGPHTLQLILYAKAKVGDTTNYLKDNPITNFSVANSTATEKAIRDLRNNFSTVYLAVGESVVVQPRVRFSDDTRMPLKPTAFSFTFDLNGVVTMDTNGKVTALRDGESNVYASALGMKATTRVIVGRHSGTPHFGRDGSVLADYVPGQSMFVGAVFGLDGGQFDRTAGLSEQVKKDGVNTIKSGFYRNPADGPVNPPETYIRNNKLAVDKVLAYADKYDFSMLLTFDDAVRTSREMKDTLTNVNAPAVIQDSLGRLKASKRVIGIEIADEGGGWGTNPHPRDGRWKRNGFEDDAFVQFYRIMGNNRPLVSMPLAGGAGEDSIRAWVGDPDPGDPQWCDYASIFFDPTSDPRSIDGRAWPDIWRFMAWKWQTYQIAAPRPMPRLMLGWIDGPTYLKGGPGDIYNPKTDRVVTAGHGPEEVALTIFGAAMLSASGINEYGYDTIARKLNRASRPIGSSVSTGSDPFLVGTDRWAGMSAALRMVHWTEPQLFSSPHHEPDFGDYVISAARSGARGRLLMIANFREAPETIRVDLTPYRLSGAVLRRSLVGVSLGDPVQVDGNEDRVTLKPGECLSYVFGVSP